jgi:ABC-2 type transport system permease protein
MSTFGQALEFEALKFRRAPVVGTVSVLIGVALPVLAAAFMVAATSDGSSRIGLKAAAMLTGSGWAGYLAMVGMLLSVGALMGIGFVVSWCFGREFTERTQACLFALPVSRRRLAAAKFAVVLLWAMLLCLVSVAVAFLAGAVIGLGVPGYDDLVAAGKAWCAGAMAALLACPLAVCGQRRARLSSRRRRIGAAGGHHPGGDCVRGRGVVSLCSARAVDGHGRRGSRRNR